MINPINPKDQTGETNPYLAPIPVVNAAVGNANPASFNTAMSQAAVSGTNSNLTPGNSVQPASANLKAGKGHGHHHHRRAQASQPASNGIATLGQVNPPAPNDNERPNSGSASAPKLNTQA